MSAIPIVGDSAHVHLNGPVDMWSGAVASHVVAEVRVRGVVVVEATDLADLVVYALRPHVEPRCAACELDPHGFAVVVHNDAPTGGQRGHHEQPPSTGLSDAP
jgi:hypothetical protein